MRSKSLNNGEGGFGISDQEERLGSDVPDDLPGEGEEHFRGTVLTGCPKLSVNHYSRQFWNKCIYTVICIHPFTTNTGVL